MDHGPAITALLRGPRDYPTVGARGGAGTWGRNLKPGNSSGGRTIGVLELSLSITRHVMGVFFYLTGPIQSYFTSLRDVKSKRFLGHDG